MVSHRAMLVCSLLALATLCPTLRAQLPPPQDIPVNLTIWTTNSGGIKISYSIEPVSGGYGPLDTLFADGYESTVTMFYRSQSLPSDQGVACSVTLTKAANGSCTWYGSNNYPGGTGAYYISAGFAGLYDADAAQYWYAPSTSNTVLAVPSQ